MTSVLMIDHGQSNWDKAVNSNAKVLLKYTDDTGWIDLPLKNIESDDNSYLRVRQVGPFIAIRAQFQVATTNTTEVASIPTNVINEEWRYLVGTKLVDSQAIEFTLTDKHTLTVRVLGDSADSRINVDTMIMSETI